MANEQIDKNEYVGTVVVSPEGLRKVADQIEKKYNLTSDILIPLYLIPKNENMKSLGFKI